jgi:hypothetical protein
MTSSEHKHQKKYTLFIRATNLEKLFYKGKTSTTYNTGNRNVDKYFTRELVYIKTNGYIIYFSEQTQRLAE